MTEETTTEQLVEIERQAEDTPATEYTPPEGWRVLAVGERLRDGDVTVRKDGYQYPTERVGGWVGSNQRYIRPIEPQPEPQPEQEPQAEPESDTELQAQVAFLKGREVTLGTRLQQEREVTTRLRGDLELVQRLLGESRQRVTELEELVGSLRTINEASEKAFEAANKENTALRNQLEAAKAELVQERLERNRWHNQVLRVTAELDDKTTQCEILQIELDAAQQVPADSPEMRQLRADLEQVTLGRDTYRDGYERVLSDLVTARKTAKAEAVEAIVEWLVPIRAVDHLNLSNEILQHLPQILRSLTGLEDEEIE